MEFTYDQKLAYDVIYKEGIFKYDFNIINFNFNVLINLRKNGLIRSFINTENELCYILNKEHPYYIKRKRSDNV
jgi:hypothetical protein